MRIKNKKINFKNIKKYIKYILFIIMLVFIYIISPKITDYIQLMAKYLYDMESSYITRVVELILAVSLILAAKITEKGDNK